LEEEDGGEIFGGEISDGEEDYISEHSDDEGSGSEEEILD